MIRCTPRCLAWTQASHKDSTSAGLRRSHPPEYMSLGFAVMTPIEVKCLGKTAAARILLVETNFSDWVVLLL